LLHVELGRTARSIFLHHCLQSGGLVSVVIKGQGPFQLFEVPKIVVAAYSESHMTTTAPVQPSSVPDTDAHRWTILALLSFVELLGMSVWFTAGATAPALSARSQLDAGATAMLTTVVQLGFVV